MSQMEPVAPMNFAPVRLRRTVQDQVYQSLRQALMTGRFDPGQAMTIDSLAKSFGVSHMPVREALRRLAAENALEQTISGSLKVPAVSKRRLDDIAQARIALERLATERAVPFLVGAALEALRAAVAAHAAVTADDGIEELLLRNHDVHFIVYRAGGAEVLPDLIEALWLRFGPYLRMISQAMAPQLATAGFANWSDYHHDLIAALDARDANAAAAAIEADVRNTCTVTAELIKDT